MKCKQPRPGFEIESQCLFPPTITTALRPPPNKFNISFNHIPFVYEFCWLGLEYPYCMNILVPYSSYGLNSSSTVFLPGWIWYYITHEDRYALKQKKIFQGFFRKHLGTVPRAPTAIGVNDSVMSHSFYYHFTPLRVFFTGVWLTVSLLKSPGLFSVFWPILTVLSFRWSPPVFLFPILPVLLPILSWLYRANWFQQVSPSPSWSIGFQFPSKFSGSYVSFRLPSILLCGQPGHQSTQFG